MSELEQRQRKDLGVLDDSAEDLKVLLEKHGVLPAQIVTTRSWANLGPRGGLSDAKRLLRGLKFHIVSAEEIQNGKQKESAQARRKRERQEANGKSGDQRKQRD